MSGMISSKRHLENGGLFKYKTRKVSATRDFPPNCGPNAVRVDSKPYETAPTGVFILEVIGAESSQVTKSVLGDDALNPITISEIENGAGFEIGGQSRQVLNSPDNGAGMLGILGEKIVVNPNSIENLVVEAGPLEGAVSKPVIEGRVRSSDALVGITAMEMDGFPNDIDDLMTANELVELMRFDDKKSDFPKKDIDGKGETVAKESDNTGDLALAKSTSDANASAHKELVAGIPQSLPAASGCVRPKEKFRKRRVSAIRDFPPHCGPNAVLPTEENEQAPTLGKDCSAEPERPPQQMVREKEVGVEHALVTMSKKVMDQSVDDAQETVERESVLQSPKRNDQERSQQTSSTLGNEPHREVVHGLMAAPNCPHRKEIAKSSSDDTVCESEARHKNLSRKKQSKSVETKTTAAADSSGGTHTDNTTFSDSREVDSNLISSEFTHKEHHSVCDQQPLAIIPLSVYDPNDEEPNEKAIIVAPPRNVSTSRTSATKETKRSYRRQKGKVVAKKSKPPSFAESSNTSYDEEGVDTGDAAYQENSSAKNMQGIDVSLPPFGPSSSSGHNDARHKVRETLRLFNTICRKLLQREESKSAQVAASSNSKKVASRFDLMTAKIIKEKKKEVNTEKKIIGEVPGVEVGDEFQYRVELALVGIHSPYIGGIDRTTYEGVPVATSIVASGAYEDDVEHAEELYYCGSGGQTVGGKKKKPEDQKLERGNLALSNSVAKRTPVRVIRGWKETRLVDPQDTRPKVVTTYVYDGLYTVVDSTTQERDNRKIFMFKLVRNPGQPELAWKELKKVNRSKTRPGTCVSDISQGKELIAIAAVNTVENEKPPTFIYTAKMMYPNWLKLNPPHGCSCSGRCSDSRKCLCAAKNGGEIPYNHNGAIVETKPIVYECGPRCKCPPSCYNRVSQRGVRLQLEIFKTEKRGWGLRALASVPSGSFICEYSGELLQDKEAEERIGNDEYLFDIGHNYQENTLSSEEQASLAEEGGYTIDAAQYGNVGRFINHSCSPNVYAQYVIYDHDDKKMPHVMLFAMENIPPLQELTYHYNYSVDQIRDADGNIKVKKCYCGSADCNGRLY